MSVMDDAYKGVGKIFDAKKTRKKNIVFGYIKQAPTVQPFKVKLPNGDEMDASVLISEHWQGEWSTLIYSVATWAKPTKKKK
jgi:hypothetical protein